MFWAEAEKMQKHRKTLCKRKQGKENLLIEFSSKNFGRTIYKRSNGKR
jgi:hypothetical protein